jgi:homoserine dehydrogenase
VPVLNLFRSPLRGNPVKGIRGILNGTSNYILSRMRKEQLPYGHVLREAIEMGIAETDPSADVEGWDAAAKVCILANALMGWDCTPGDVEVTGITEVTLEAIQLAWDSGFGIRLVGEIIDDGDGRQLTVSPRLVPQGNPLLVEDTLNAIVFSTELAGDIIVVGRGAGTMETASALLSDSLVVADRVGEKDKS